MKTINNNNKQNNKEYEKTAFFRSLEDRASIRGQLANQVNSSLGRKKEISAIFKFSYLTHFKHLAMYTTFIRCH